jgi:F-type H+-transporting ATPase subunit b
MLQARQEANALIAAAQKAAADAREADIAATKGELEQMRVRAAADIAAERDRAMADLRSQVAELALDVATKVTGETMTDDRQRRLVNEFINQRQDPSGTSN